ncbi:hypothetical protein BT63DRAFT_448186 [Microthyrium microscopicum]|uniref:SnoaL-like domain-containing protein n=1 Tax=Microthyrium microscopicum TaxID=703497 RepID=A0A6A6U3P8_9PEZI|nr:hypothetical protein BT63DRAFT_448186 [Microthyrium microscopicum]
MRVLTWFTALLATPLVVLAVPQRGGGKAAPTPCKRQSPPPSEAETKARFDAFVEVFVGKQKSIYKSFEYIAADYINHNPMAKNGSASAWGILSPIWDNTKHTYIRSTFKSPMSWVNYKSGGMGEIVDRFRWDGGCIAEHWDQGERYPSS